MKKTTTLLTYPARRDVRAARPLGWPVIVLLFAALIGCGTAATPAQAQPADAAQADDGKTAKMPPRIINPREGITGNTVYTLWHPDVPMDLPIQVQGGAFPFTYELTQGPDGMTLGSTYGGEDYGILEWDKPAPGTHAIAIKVTDQDGTVVTREYDLTIIDDRDATDQIIFVDGDAPAGGDGSIARPLNKLEDAQAAAHAGKTAIIREGRYTLTSARFHKEAPNRWVGFPGEEVVFVNRKLTTNWYTGDGACINITWDEIHQDAVYGEDIEHGNGACMRIWHGGGEGHGVGFVAYKLTFKNFPFHPGEPTNLNTACIMTPRSGEYKENIGISDMLVDGLGYMAVENYRVRYFLLERVTVKNVERGASSPILFQKVATQYVTTRDCDVWENINRDHPIEWYTGGRGDDHSSHGEVCFSRLKGDLTFQRAAHDGGGVPFWFYRNTLIGDITYRGEFGPMVFANNVIIADRDDTYQDSGVRFINADRDDRFPPDVSGQEATFIGGDDLIDQVLDAEGRLKDEYRARYLGKHGHEIMNPDPPAAGR